MPADQSRRIDRALDLSGLPELERSAWVEVDIDQLADNARALHGLAKPAALGIVVKADGYGHGLEMAARSAVVGGALWLCVADASEAKRLRADGYQGRVFVLYPVPPATVATLAGLGVDATVGSRAEVEQMDARLASGNGPDLAVHLEIDTGMTRGGVSPSEAVNVAADIVAAPTLTLAGVWTHLAAPEEVSVTKRQLDRFDSARADLAHAGIEPPMVHAAASGGLLTIDATGHTLVRPGLGYYGVDPGVGTSLPPSIQAALQVKAHPVRIVTVPPGTSVGYAGTWTAPTESVIATLPIGYADGWSRASSPGGKVLVEGATAPVVGRISSDSLTVDVSGILDVGPDSEITLLGRDGSAAITADEVATVRGTISWEVLQQLGSRLARVYFSHDAAVAMRAEMATEVTMSTGATMEDYR